MDRNSKPFHLKVKRLMSVCIDSVVSKLFSGRLAGLVT
jgi:hypothetical protein